MSEEGPAGILYAESAIDGQYPAWQSPAAELAITCTYRRSVFVGRFQLLRRSHDRCLNHAELRQVTAEPGETIVVHEPGNAESIVIAHFDYPVSLERQVLSTVLKSFSHDRVIIDGPEHRFLTGTTSNPHLVHVPRSPLGLANGGMPLGALMFPDAWGVVKATFFEIPLATR